MQIKEFSLQEGNEHFNIFNKSLFTRDFSILLSHQVGTELSIPGNTTCIGNLAFSGYSFPLKIPAQIQSFQTLAFYNYFGKTIMFFSPYNEVKGNSFGYSFYLEEVKFFDSVSIIECDAFSFCLAIKRVFFSILPKFISDSAFAAEITSKICFYGDVQNLSHVYSLDQIHLCSCRETCIYVSKHISLKAAYIFMIILS